MFKKESGDWKPYRNLSNVVEVDFHYSAPRDVPYLQAMEEVWSEALEVLKKAYDEGKKHVLFTHGSSTSRPGKTTARSQVRSLMRSREATPYICRRECLQHETVFIAAIRTRTTQTHKRS